LPDHLLHDPLFTGRIIGLDPSREMLNFAAKKLKPYFYRAALVQQTAVPLPFANNTFDAITCLEALEFFPSDKAAVAEMVRVVKPNGVVLVTRRRGRDGKLFPGRYKSVDQFEAMLINLGLDDVQTVPWQVEYDQVYGRKAS
jgi:ubiquinone/menaquinone biosynthesis C-methylase UbiE